jgi:hypothetical protein
VVERTLAWISKHRRAVRDDERLPAPRRDGHLAHGGADDPTAGWFPSTVTSKLSRQ